MIFIIVTFCLAYIISVHVVSTLYAVSLLDFYFIVLFPSCSLGAGTAIDGTSEWRSTDHINWSANHGPGCTRESRSNHYASSSLRITGITTGQYA